MRWLTGRGIRGEEDTREKKRREEERGEEMEKTSDREEGRM